MWPINMLSSVRTNLAILSLVFCRLAIESEKQIQICRFGTFGRAPVVPLQARLEEFLKAFVRIVGYTLHVGSHSVIPLTTYSEAVAMIQA